MLTLSDLTLDQLADGICLRAGRIAAAEAELLEWIAEFDKREGWAGPTGGRDGLRRRPDLVVQGPRDHARRATRRRDRVGRPRAQHLRGASGEARPRPPSRAPDREAGRDPERAEWLLRTRKTYDDDGNLVMTIYANAEVAPVIEAAIETKRAELERERASADADVPAGTSGAPEAERDVPAEAPAAEPVRVTDGDALLAMAQDSLAAARPSADLARRNRYRLTAELDPLSGWARLRDGELLPPTSLTAVLRSLPGRGGPVRLRAVTPADLRRHDLGRTSREVSANLRELLGRIDGERCRFPGCTRNKKLHAHHVVYWSAGGCTDFDNLILVCSRHHTLVHSQGFRVVLHDDRRLDVRTAEGVAVLHHPGQPWGDPAALALSCGEPVSAETLPPDDYDARMDLGYVVSVLLAQAS